MQPDYINATPTESLPIQKDIAVDCGWGRLLFGQTFQDSASIASAIEEETDGRRDIAFYIDEPHVLLAQAPQGLFLDPSHSFRLKLDQFDVPPIQPNGLVIRPAIASDEIRINAIYKSRGMVPVWKGFIGQHVRINKTITLLVAEDQENAEIVGVVLGVDHSLAFNDPENGSSLWALAVDTQARLPAIGKKLVIALAHHFKASGRQFMDLSVVHTNEDAISLYKALGFEQVPVYCVKKKNTINEKLFIGSPPEADLNIYAQIITDEARRRGIVVEIEDEETGLFRLSLGGRTIACRESLTDLTSAVAMSRCDDKMLTHRLLHKGELNVPAQRHVANEEEAIAFLNEYQRIVIKPVRGEQGQGVAVDLQDETSVREAFTVAQRFGSVIAEQFATGNDLRIIVIGQEVVAAAVREPASIVGDGVHSIQDLIEKQSRRRSAATRGESTIPIDAETKRCVVEAKYTMETVLPEGMCLVVRKTANLHTGGTISDVTPLLHPVLADAAIKAASILDMPVVGFDFLVTSPSEADYVIIEANERPGLANHAPAPTAERFIDFLFPQTKANWLKR